MSSWSTLLGRAAQTTERPYHFDDGEKVVSFPTDIAALGQAEVKLTNMLVEIDGDLQKLVNERNAVSEQLNGVRERIANWARDHGVKAEVVKQEPIE